MFCGHVALALQISLGHGISIAESVGKTQARRYFLHAKQDGQLLPTPGRKHEDGRLGRYFTLYSEPH